MRRSSIHIISLISICLSSLLVSCEMRDELWGKKPGEVAPGEVTPGGSGSTSPDEVGILDLQLDVKVPSFTTKAFEVSAPNADDLKVSIFDSNNQLLSYFDSYTEFKEQTPVKLPAGVYRVEASSGDNLDATFDSPYYETVEQYEVKKKEVVTVKGTCEMQSAVVSLLLSDEFLDACTDDYVIIITNGSGVLTVSKDDPKVAYVKAGSVISIVIKATDKKTLTPVTNSFKLTNEGGGTSSKDLFTITIKDLEEEIIPDDPISPDPDPDPNPNPNPDPDPDPNPDPEKPSGSGKLTITVDVTLNEKPIDIIVPSNPDNNNPGDNEDDDDDNNNDGDDAAKIPTVTGDGINTPVTVKKGGSSSVVVNIAAPNGLNKLQVRIDSPLLSPEELEGIGLKSEFDLADPGTLKDALNGLGFPTGDDVKGKTTVKFDISQFVPLLGLLGTGTSKFHLTVTDTKGNTVSKTITIVITE